MAAGGFLKRLFKGVWGTKSPNIVFIYFYRDLRCVLAQFGGNWNNGVKAGMSNWNLNNTSSNSNVNNGRQTLVSNFMV